MVARRLIDRPAGVFTRPARTAVRVDPAYDDASTDASRHGHRRRALPVPELRATDAGGTPYGASHWSETGDRGLDDNEAAMSRLDDVSLVGLRGAGT